jgi:hypothetical protein
MYWEAITIIEAQNMLAAMKVQDYPHLKQSDRSKSYKEIAALAYPKHLQQSKTVSLLDFAKMMAGKS